MIELQPSELIWRVDEASEQQALILESGVVELKPYNDSDIEVSVHQLNVRTNSDEWPELDAVLRISEQGWISNISQIEVNYLLPLLDLVPEQQGTSDFLDELSPHGLVEDIRLSQLKGEELKYSASITDLGMAQWELLPEVHHASAILAGTPNKQV